MTKLSIVSAADQAGYCTFASALRNTDHVRTLDGAGPFTVFAPSDAAFKKFSTAALDQLLDGDRDLLALVMGYHFAPGRVVAKQFEGKRIKAVMHDGGDVIINGRDGLSVNAAHIVQANIQAANGIIHGIDAVLWPKSPAPSPI